MVTFGFKHNVKCTAKRNILKMEAIVSHSRQIKNKCMVLQDQENQ